MKILLTGAFNYSEAQIKSIKDLGYKISFIQDEREKIKFDISDIEVVICNNLFLYNEIDKFKSLKLIQLTSSGFDRVPLKYITEKNIHIFNARDVYSVPIAEWVILKILEVYKHSHFFYQNQLEHQWIKKRNLLELTDKKVGIIGFGSIGLELAKKLQAFNTEIIAINRSKVESEYIDRYIPLKQLNKVLPELDVIVLTISLTKNTEGIITQDEIELMKDDSVLVNVARGELIVESELINSLGKGKFLGVVLDVFNEEPLPANNPLWEFKNTIITPHNSFVSDKNNERLFNLIFDKLKKIMTGDLK